MKKFILILLNIFTLSLSSTFASTKVNKKSVNKEMVEIATILQDVYPQLFISIENLSDAQKASLRTNIVSLKDKFKSLEEHFSSKSVNFKISYNVINQYMSDVTKVAESNHYYFAQKMLQGLPQICISCHTQDHRYKTIFQGMQRSKFSSEILYADYLYTVRDYKKAIKYYEQYIKQDVVKNNELEILRVMQQVVLYYAEIKSDESMALNTIKKWEDKFMKTPLIVKNLSDWKKALNNLHVKKNKDHFMGMLSEVKKFNFEGVMSYGAERFEMMIWQNRMVYYLNTKAKNEEIPELLYWLSKLERKTDNNLFYSYSDLYLRECVMSYSKSPYAKECFKEYEQQMEFAFTGSRGTDIPKDVKNDIDTMRNMVNIKP